MIMPSFQGGRGPQNHRVSHPPANSHGISPLLMAAENQDQDPPQQPCHERAMSHDEEGSTAGTGGHIEAQVSASDGPVRLIPKADGTGSIPVTRSIHLIGYQASQIFFRESSDGRLHVITSDNLDYHEVGRPEEQAAGEFIGDRLAEPYRVVERRSDACPVPLHRDAVEPAFGFDLPGVVIEVIGPPCGQHGRSVLVAPRVIAVQLACI